jgi:tripartite-type tricarboxylate transporter receptor subunit TctC
MLHTTRRALVICAHLLVAGGLCAQTTTDYPNRPIRMIVPFVPGGSSDFTARILQPKLSEALAQQVVVDNRSGASGNVGVEIGARAPADGYTLFLGNIGTMAINPSIFPKFPVRPLRDLISVTMVVDIPGGLGIHPSVPAATIKEFIEHAKSRPGQLNYGSAGAGSAQRLAFEVFMNKAGIKLVHIPYKGGAGAATTAVLSGEVAATMVTVASFIPFAKSGRLRILGVIAPHRIPQLPDVPTLAESGFPELTVGSWQGMYLPAGTPKPIVNKVFAAVTKVLADPWVVERFTAGGALVLPSKSTDEFLEFMKSQNALWEKTIKQIGVTGE